MKGKILVVGDSILTPELIEEFKNPVPKDEPAFYERPNSSKGFTRDFHLKDYHNEIECLPYKFPTFPNNRKPKAKKPKNKNKKRNGNQFQ